MAQQELIERVASLVFEFEDPTEVETDGVAIALVAEYYELCDYGVADIDALNDPEAGRSETYMLYYMLKLLNEEGHIQYKEEK